MRPRGWPWFASLLALIVIAGSCKSLPALPSQGGPAWIELTSDHFTIWTDASESTARALVPKLENTRQVILGMAFPSSSDAGRIFVIAFRSEWELKEFLPPGTSAMTFVTDTAGQLTLALTADVDDRPDVVAHELTHAVSRSVLPHQPRWFAEGLATFFESTSMDPNLTTVDLGKPSPSRLKWLSHAPLLSVAQMMTCSEHGGCDIGSFYNMAWAFYSYLANVQPETLRRIQELLATLPPQDANRVWEIAFPKTDYADLTSRVRSWLTQGSTRVWHFHVIHRPFSISVRPLQDADVLAARAYLYSLHPSRPTAKHAVTAALSTDPTNDLASFVQWRLTAVTAPSTRPDPTLAGRVAATHPESWWAQYLAYLAHPTGPQRALARARLCTLVARNSSIVLDRRICPRVVQLDPAASADPSPPPSPSLPPSPPSPLSLPSPPSPPSPPPWPAPSPSSPPPSTPPLPSRPPSPPAPTSPSL
ncbi:MAG TPA: hypothetical protein VGM88_20580 [Kofleriaceae bacterium]|jgi:hypothetical protein